MIVHIARADDLARAERTGRYAPASLAEEGFIHLSRPDYGTLNLDAVVARTPLAAWPSNGFVLPPHPRRAAEG